MNRVKSKSQAHSRVVTGFSPYEEERDPIECGRTYNKEYDLREDGQKNIDDSRGGRYCYNLSTRRRIFMVLGITLGTIVFFFNLQTESNSYNHQYLTVEGDSKSKVETVLIIAAVPRSPEYIKALWSHLECLTDGIDKVVISAPDTPWSMLIMESLVTEYNKQLRAMGNFTSNNIEIEYFTNNRYDVGLWCDALQHNLGFGTSSMTPRAVYLINDSVITVKPYTDMTQKVLNNTRIEQEGTENEHIKVLSLNGDFRKPEWSIHDYWIESVYRGFTPEGISTFYRK